MLLFKEERLHVLRVYRRDSHALILPNSSVIDGFVVSNDTAWDARDLHSTKHSGRRTSHNFSQLCRSVETTKTKLIHASKASPAMHPTATALSGRHRGHQDHHVFRILASSVQHRPKTHKHGCRLSMFIPERNQMLKTGVQRLIRQHIISYQIPSIRCSHAITSARLHAFVETHVHIREHVYSLSLFQTIRLVSMTPILFK